MNGNMTPNSRKIAVSSLLFGVAVGDALGVPVEFRPRGSFRVSGMRGYGTHNQPPGTWSDDTSLTLCLADSLSRGFAPDGIAWNFLKWYDEGAFTAHGEVFDIGISTAKAISRLKSGTAPDKAGCAGANENGNGSLMRIAPLVFYLDGKPDEERFSITRAVSSITHAHAWSVAACFIYLEYLRKLARGMEKRAAYVELCGDFSDRNPCIEADTLGKFARILRSDLSALPESGIRSGGFVIDTLEAALWCFLTTDSYRDAVLKAVNLGEDTDTTAAVTGALAGITYGLDAIPAEWLKTLAASEDIRRLAGAMAKALAG
ncbi:MAG: ADP-ribosylglycohydrolase family protein [Spirochaetaceae bacterium]|jgi:ADP-ribosylglycohydrolase|nr:ADP-ribosylglycohydrolase family protein [Spirochaetaceae bacterium]